jgi:very-short-patch-repair endonuclease
MHRRDGRSRRSIRRIVGWRQQFKRGLDRYLDENHLRLDERFPPLPHDGIDPDDDWGADEDSLWLPLYGRVFASQVAEVADRDLERWVERTDPNSPPEWAMLMALRLVGGERFRDGVLFASERGTVDLHYGDFENYLIIAPQVTIAKYRVDFLLTHVARIIDEIEYPPGVAGHQDAQGRVVKELVVECDGHDFHDRTKQQASQDRERDRGLQLRDLSVVRFTGSDIYRDPFRCANDALDVLEAQVNRVARAPAP